MKVPTDQQFAAVLTDRFNLTIPVGFRKYLRAKGIELHPHDEIILAFVHKSNGGGTHQAKLIDEGAGKDGRAKERSRKPRER